MSDQTVNEPKMSQTTVPANGIDVVIRRVDPEAKGFMPLWKRLISVKRGIMDIQRAQPEDIDAAYSLLSEFIVEPHTDREKTELLNDITGNELMDLFTTIMGTGNVPPAKGGA